MSAAKRLRRNNVEDIHNFCTLMGWCVQNFLQAYEDLVIALWPPDNQDAWVSFKLVRPTDPEPSVEAAMAVAHNLEPLQVCVFTFMMRHNWPQLHMLCEDAFVACTIHPVEGMSTARSRCNELVKMGLVEATGQKERNRAGNRAGKYRVKPEVRRRAAAIMNAHGLHVSDTDGPEPPPVPSSPVPPSSPPGGQDTPPSGGEAQPLAASGEAQDDVIVVAATLIMDNAPSPLPRGEEKQSALPWETPPPVSPEPSTRALSLDEDTGNIKSWWTLGWSSR